MSLLEAADISVRFGGHRALDSASLSIGAGEVVGLLGRNGAGKTTMLEAVAGSLRPSSGRIVLDGRDITAQPAHRRARLGIARTFQAVDLIGALTVRENIMLGCQARQRSGLFSDGLRLPRSRHDEIRAGNEVDRHLDLMGLRLVAGAPVADLPLGERRLVEVARALCLRPRVLLLDEVGSGMDGGELSAMADLVLRISAELGVGLLLVEHDLNFVFGVCDFIYLLDSGTVVARGTPAALRQHPRAVAYMGMDDVPAAASG